MKTREEISDGLEKAIREMEERNIGLTQPSWEAIILAAAYLEGKHNWIPVEERLPEENTTPLVRMDLSDKFDEETIIYDVVVFDQNGFHTPYKVTHWMEIQPPRKED